MYLLPITAAKVAGRFCNATAKKALTIFKFLLYSESWGAHAALGHRPHYPPSDWSELIEMEGGKKRQRQTGGKEGTIREEDLSA